MALKADRQIDAVEVGYFFNNTGEQGSIVVVGTVGSGVAMDNVSNQAVISAGSSGTKPLGMLLQDVVSVDLTRFPINWHKDQAASGDKVTILTKGWAVTNKVTTATGGTAAVLTSSGCTMDQPGSWNSAANPLVGLARSGVDENGYAKIYVDL